MLEVVVAIFVLTIGVISAAALAGAMLSTGSRSRYIGLSATLASEKLEDLNRWNVEAPEVCVPSSSSSVGSLASDVLQTTTCPTGASDSVVYYDDVGISFANSTSDCVNSSAGCFAESVAKQSGGTTQYTTTYHSPDGHITAGAPTATPPANMTFHRRWVIEANSPVNGVRRVTVQVVLTNPSVHPGATFQMSLVRP